MRKSVFLFNEITEKIKFLTHMLNGYGLHFTTGLKSTHVGEVLTTRQISNWTYMACKPEFVKGAWHSNLSYKKRRNAKRSLK